MRSWMKAIVIAVLGSLGPLASEGSWAQGYPPEVTELLSKAKAQVSLLNMSMFKNGFDQKSLGIIIDVREPAEFAEGHVPGAINIPRGLIEFRIWSHVGYPERLDKNQRITIYCGSGARAALAAKSLRDLNFSNVNAVDMRFEEWKKAGYPLDRDQGAP
jgi:rhodanese-related sulfurtransferase